MQKILLFMLLVSVALITRAQEKEGRTYAENYDVQAQKEGTATYHNDENAKRNENGNENEKKKCDGNSSPAENALARLTNAGEYEIIYYLYPAYPPAQPYYSYEVPLVYEK